MRRSCRLWRPVRVVTWLGPSLCSWGWRAGITRGTPRQDQLYKELEQDWIPDDDGPHDFQSDDEEEDNPYDNNLDKKAGSHVSNEDLR